MPIELLIRACTRPDEDAVAALWSQAFSITRPWHEPVADVRRKLEQRDDLLLVGIFDGALVATAMIGYDGHRGWIYRVAVAPDQRRRGFGSAMMRAAEERLRRHGCPKINLQVEGTNPDVVGFYQQLGYAVEERVSMGKPL